MKAAHLCPLMPLLIATIPIFKLRVVKQFDVYLESNESQIWVCEKASLVVAVFSILLSTHSCKLLPFHLTKAIIKAHGDFVIPCPHPWAFLPTDDAHPLVVKRYASGWLVASPLSIVNCTNDFRFALIHYLEREFACLSVSPQSYWLLTSVTW